MQVIHRIKLVESHKYLVVLQLKDTFYIGLESHKGIECITITKSLMTTLIEELNDPPEFIGFDELS